MILEINNEASCFVPSVITTSHEVNRSINTVNGHTIESLAADSAFNRNSGCELDRLIHASHALRQVINSDSVKRARQSIKPKR